MIEYCMGTSGQVLVFRDAVVEHLRRYQQHRWYQREAGGQLFARFDSCRILVEEATGPRSTDRRTRTSYVPDRKAEQAEILDRHSCGFHFVGDWHTHPERIPQSSCLDEMGFRECVKKSGHLLNGFVLVIVGQAELPDGLHVSVHDGTSAFTLVPSTAADS